jgi:alkaline phosphatase
MARAKENPDAGRRNFMRTGMASAILLGAGVWPADAVRSKEKAKPTEGSARNVIFLVSDGMSSGTLAMADILLRRREGRPSHWISLYERNDLRRGLMDMASLDSIVTDSSAASSSWGCGYRVNNNSVNIGPGGEQYTPVLKAFRDAGKGTGLVTTTTITHATPAGFGANVPQRGMEQQIAEQYLERRYDVLLGGGTRFFDGARRTDGRNLFADFRNAGYRVVGRKTELYDLPNNADPVLGTFASGHLPFALDHINTPEYRESIPTLAEMTQIALNRLSRNGNGFIVQVEGGRVDHAAHGNDVGGLIYDQIAFDDAVGVAVEFAEHNPDTLVIVTTDHGNANPGVNSPNANRNFDRIQEFTHTNSWIMSGVDESSTVSAIQARVEEATSLKIRKEEAHVLLKSVLELYTPPYRLMSQPSAVLGQILANYTSVNWIGSTHTSDYVELAAFGPGSEAVRPFVKNTEMFAAMTHAAGVPVSRG